ncbi:MAG: hypothetical protein U0744_15090 [Gemmataceae bacterium]
MRGVRMVGVLRFASQAGCEPHVQAVRIDDDWPIAGEKEFGEPNP